jgi:hypothetical protein
VVAASYRFAVSAGERISTNAALRARQRRCDIATLIAKRWWCVPERLGSD